MRICIFGAGATGGHLAAKLGAAGHEVSVIARGEHLRAIQEKGIKLLHGDQTFQAKVRASDSTNDLGKQDFVIVTLKANLLDLVAERVAPLLGPDTGVVFAQNGIPWWYALGLGKDKPKPPDLGFLDPGGKLARAVPAERVLGAAIFSANDVESPGVIHNHTMGNNMLTVGEADDRQSKRVVALREALSAADVYSPPVPDIRQSLWSKVPMNLGTSPLAVLCGSTVAELVDDPQLGELRKRCVREGKAIAAAHGIDVDGAPKRPSGGHFAGGTAHKPSMLQDYERGRPMEIDSQLQAPLAFARAAGVATPTLDALIPVAARKAAEKGLYHPGTPPAAR